MGREGVDRRRRSREEIAIISLQLFPLSTLLLSSFASFSSPPSLPSSIALPLYLTSSAVAEW